MNMVTTKAMAKVAAVATGLAMATSMLSLAPYAHAASLTSSQVQSILSLLSSFGADSATIANVQASLTGGTPSSTTSGSTTTTTTCSFGTKDLTMGSTGAAVTSLQQALINGGYSIPAGATGYFGGQTRSAVIAWQKAAGVTPTAGYFGAKSRAAFKLNCSSSSTTTTTTTTTTATAGTGTGLKVSLAATSPNGSVLVAGQGIGDLADFVFANPTSAPINVTALSFKRTGVSNDSSLVNVYLYNGATRITDSAGVSNSAFTFSDPTALFTVGAGQTYTVSVRSDIAASGSTGSQIGVSLVSATSNGTLDSSVSFPVMGGYQTVSSALLATVDYSSSVSPAGNPTISPQNDYPVWQDTVSVSVNPVKLTSLSFINIGSIDSSNLINLRLYVDGVQVGAAVPAMNVNRSVTFDFSAAPVMLSTQSHVIKVLANITGGAGNTIQFSVQRSSDGMFVDSQLNQPVTPSYNGVGNNFSAVTTSVVQMNAVTSNSGVSVSLSPTSPNQTVAVGASNVKWASFSMLASGENVRVSDLYVTASSSLNGVIDHTGGLANGKIYLNGVQVGSTKNIPAIGTTADFSFGSSLILPAGQTVTVDVYADAKTQGNLNLQNGDSVYVTLVAGSSNAQGMSSYSSTPVPATNSSGTTITVSSSSLTANKYSGYGNQTMIAGAIGAKLGAFTLSTGSTEGVTINTIAFSLATGNSASITNLVLKDDATGATLGSVISTPNDSSNSYSVTLNIPASSTKTIDIIGNILSGANVGTIKATILNSTSGTGDLTGISTHTADAGVPLQNIIVGAGTLTVTTGAGDPTSNNVLAGASSIQVGEFNFAAQNSSYTVQNLAILIPNGAATSVTNVTVSYKDVNGATQTATQPLAVNAAMAYATATFNGLTMYVPANDSANLDVSVGTPTVASGAVSGAAIKVTLDAGANTNVFRAINNAGSAITVVSSGLTSVASNGTFYVRKSIPTFAMLSTGNTVPSTGSPVYKFSITADPAGAIEWTHLTFNVATSGGTTNITGLYLTDDASGVKLDDQNATTTTGAVQYFDLGGNTTSAKYAQVAAGATKTYDLYGAVSGYTTGSTITISLAADASPLGANEAAAPYVAGNTVWSDRSASGHTVNTSDWTNGYLIKNFTNNAVSYSK